MNYTSFQPAGTFPSLNSNVDDSIHQLLQKLLETEDLAEFDAVSLELKRELHKRIENLRKDAQVLKRKSSE